MVLELRDKLDAFGTTTAPVTTVLPVEEDVLSALENLGYQRALVQKALGVVGGGKQNFDELFRKTLGVLAK